MQRCIVHTVLIGIHCRGFGSSPKTTNEVSPRSVSISPRVPAPYRPSIRSLSLSVSSAAVPPIFIRARRTKIVLAYTLRISTLFRFSRHVFYPIHLSKKYFATLSERDNRSLKISRIHLKDIFLGIVYSIRNYRTI